MNQLITNTLSQKEIKISVIIATYNRAKSLYETLQALSAQTLCHEQYEVIVVDDGSSDGTSDIAERFIIDHPTVQFTFHRHQTNRLKSAACNTGIDLARGEFIAFTDDDTRPAITWLETHLLRHAVEKKPVAVIGLVLYPEAWERKSNWIHFANENYKKNKKISVASSGILPPTRLIGCNISIPKDILISVGKFNEKMDRGQDGELGCRLFLQGIPLVFEEKALVYHYADAIRSIDKTLSSFRRYYEKDMQYIHKYYPWAHQNYGSWFIEPYDPNCDTNMRMIIKKMVKYLARQDLQRLAISALKLTDGYSWAYMRILHQYAFACEAIDAIHNGYKNQPASVR